MASYRGDIVTKDLILRALKSQSSSQNVEIISLEVCNGTEKGENFLGDLASVEVKAMVDNVEKSFSWIIKMLKPDSGSFNLARLLGVFDTEMKIYQELIPALKSCSGSVELGETVPMVFVQSDKGQEALILDHMKQYGWRDAMNKKRGLDVHHVAKVMEWLAKFHGLSYVMMQQYPEGPEGWIKAHPWALPIPHRIDPGLRSMMGQMRQQEKTRFVKHAKLLEKPEDEGKYSSWMDSVFESGVKLDDLRFNMQKYQDGTFNTINHLDPWFNNMLFKYDPASGELKDVLLLDFQGSGYCNVGNDLAHFFLSSTTKAFRDESLDAMLKVYHESLVSTVKDSFGEDLCYTLEELKKDYSKGLGVGLTFCFNALPMILGDPEDTVDFGAVNFDDAKAREDFQASTDILYEATLGKNQNVQERLRGILDDLIDAKYFEKEYM